MKKICLIAAALSMVLTACNYETKAYKAMKYSRDSLMVVQQRTVDELDNMLKLVAEVDSGFDAIRASQNYVVMATGTENPNEETRQRISNGMLMVNDLLAANRQKIEELDKQLSSGKIQSSELRKKVQKLTEQLQQQNDELITLRTNLEKKNIQIDSLMVETKMYSEKANLLQSENEAYQQTVSAQDAALHRVYYMIATKRELKANNVDPKGMKAAFRQDLFTTGDMREINRIDTGANSAKLLTKHPVGSYELQRNADRTYTLVIKNPTDFWSASRYLIIQI